MRRRINNDEIDQVLAEGMWICIGIIVVILALLGLT